MTTIVRLAAKGDGVADDGAHYPGTAPGDRVAQDGSIVAGPHRADPPCRHFPQCGGCQLQHVDDESLRGFVTDRVVNAAKGQGVEIGELLPTRMVDPATRRRATLHGLRRGKRTILGFKEERSNRIVDMRECHVLRPELFALVAPLRTLLGTIGTARPIGIALTLIDQGVDCALDGVTLDNYPAIEAVTDFAQAHELARISADQGYGPEILWEPHPATVSLSGVPVGFPVKGFLQPSRESERWLTDDVRRYAAGADRIADLFAGLGTFAFALNGERRRITAYEAGREAHLAFMASRGGRTMLNEYHRDLFRNPLNPAELEPYDCIVLDPPRAGARAQIEQIGASEIARVVYVSCNPASWSRDAALLETRGFRLRSVRPVGQFRWSTHVELTSVFIR